MQRSNEANAWLKARSTSSVVPDALAGSEMPQCAVMGWPGQSGQTSCAALSHTVKTKCSGGQSGLENSSHDLLRTFVVLNPAFSICLKASGRTYPVG